MERRILVIDDDRDIKITTEDYVELFNKLKHYESRISNFDLKFDICSTIEEAISKLREEKYVYHSMLIDYDFNENSDSNIKNGIQLIDYIRESFNARIQIIFYTMHPIDDINKDQLFQLCNSNISRFIFKDSVNTLNNLKYKLVEGFEEADQVVVEAIIESLSKYALSDNPICSGLEELLLNYRLLDENFHIVIDDNNFKVLEVLNAIRLDKELGKKYIDLIVRQSILSSLTSKKLEGVIEWK
ncbi:hypothetical protein [Acetoanaerobium noterae]|uniref:hypothetical protein n=1 Tax=Acetoanaerobium noterae TaxID=745369 RepID=UPI0033416DE7